MLLKGSKVIVTGGPTREWFDPIRYLSNASTGKMGVALADEAFSLAREIVFVHGPINGELIKDKPYRCRAVESTADLLNAVLDEIEEKAVIIMSAAPADYTPVEKSDEKIKKSDGEILFRMKRTPDILKNISSVRVEKNLNDLFVVGFAAETTNTEEYAKGKLRSKNLDMICLNDVSVKGAGFGSDTNLITLFSRHGDRVDLPMLSKKDAAKEILVHIEAELNKRG